MSYVTKNKKLGNATKPGFHATAFLFLASDLDLDPIKSQINLHLCLDIIFIQTSVRNTCWPAGPPPATFQSGL